MSETPIESIPLVPINLDKTPMPWKREFQLLTHPDLLEMAAIEREVDPLFCGAYYHVAKVLHWVIKLRWDTKHKLPKLPRGQKKAYKPLGALYNAVIEICQECHFWGYGEQYDNAAQWFIEVLAEGALDCPNVDQSKDSDIKDMQNQNKCLFSAPPENPFKATEEPSTYELIKAAIAIRGESDVFRKTKWRQLKKARLEWLSEYRQGSWRSPRKVVVKNKEGEVIGEKVVLQVGRGGNQTKTLPPLVLG